MKIFPVQVIPSDHILVRTPLQSLQKAYNPLPPSSPIFEEGLYLASPEFWQEYQKKGSLNGKSQEKLDRTFNKYWLRSCTRCTPYASFAGCTLAEVRDEDTRITLQANQLHTRKVRLDMNYMTQIIQAILKIPSIFQQLRFYANNSIYELATGFRYVEYTIQNNTRHYQLTSIAKTPYLQSILALAEKGVLSGTLRNLLVQEADVTPEEADDFILDLWQSQLLVSELEPAVTGAEPLEQLIVQLSNLHHTKALLTSLNRIQELIQAPSEGVVCYQLIEEELKSLHLDVEIPKNTLQVDLFLSTQDCRFNKGLIHSIVNQARDLMLLARRVQNADLDNFRTRFLERYENSEIPLSIALDADLGIGYSTITDDMAGGTALINDLQIRVEPARRSGNIDYIQQYIMTKYHDYLQNGKPFITITEDELEGFRKDAADCHFSNSMFLMGSLMKKDGKLDPDNYVFDLSEFGGPNAGSLLGRFTAGDRNLCAVTRALLKQEEEDDPDAIYAEIVHLPQARIGNILLRPVLRQYEIPYVGKSAADADHLIMVEDLLISVHNQEVILRSKKHHKRVIPRLTTAHNFSQDSLPVYKFLCHLQYQGLSHPNTWDWGLLSDIKQLPRVVYKNLIIRKAQWNITGEDVDGMPKDPSGYMEYFKRFRVKLKLPARVVYVEHDNDLLIDFEQDKGIQLFLHYLSRHKKILLEEFPATPENCIVQDTAGEGYTNEIIIPLHVKEETDFRFAKGGLTMRDARFTTEDLPETVAKIQRKFGPGSQWLYFKVYCGSKTGDKLLREFLLDFVENGLKDTLFEKFFFIRYKDEFPHLRIRFFNSDPDKQMAVQKLFLSAIQPYLDVRLVDKVVIDTYLRELERYGGGMIGYAEELFFADSLAILRFMNLIDETGGDKYRLLFALRSIDMLLDDFCLDLPGKKRLSAALQASFFKEFGADPILQKQLNEKYRERQESIFAHLDSSMDPLNGIEEATDLFKTRSRMNLPIISFMVSTGKPEEKKDRALRILPDLIHVSMNRLFIAQQRKYELAVYHFLDKYYTSQMAIQKRSGLDLQ